MTQEQDFFETVRKSWFAPRSGWCWFNREDVLLSINPARNRRLKIRGKPRECILEVLTSNRTQLKLPETLSRFNPPGWQSMVEAARGQVKQTKNSLEFLNLNSPRQLWLELTTKCQLNCRHCYQETSDSNQLSQSQVKKLLNKAARAGFEQVQFTGGEPLLWPGIEPALGTATALGLNVEIFTNGVKIPQIYDSLAEHKPRLAFSIYSHNPEVHDGITGKPGSWQDTRRGLKMSLEGPTPVRTSIVITDKNHREVSKTREYLKELGVPEKRIRANYVQQTRPEHRELTPPRDTEKDGGEASREDNGFSNPGKLCVTAAGDVIPCVFNRWVRLGNVANRSLNEIIKKPELEKIAEVPAEDITGSNVLACGECRFHYILCKYLLSRKQ